MMHYKLLVASLAMARGDGKDFPWLTRKQLYTDEKVVSHVAFPHIKAYKHTQRHAFCNSHNNEQYIPCKSQDFITLKCGQGTESWLSSAGRSRLNPPGCWCIPSTVQGALFFPFVLTFNAFQWLGVPAQYRPSLYAPPTKLCAQSPPTTMLGMPLISFQSERHK